ncbi:hypothetical protein HDV05_002771 [Chytridiales sp. JEL 0842]|nr:hypothetical protein HDV05_002771 [Chytridiales sp. JEL 0842]
MSVQPRTDSYGCSDPPSSNPKTINLTVRNTFNRNVTVLWVASNCSERTLGEIAPGSAQGINGFAGQVYLAREPTANALNLGRVLTGFKLTPDNTEWIIAEAGGQGASIGLIVGAVLGSLAVLGIGGALVWFFVIKKRRQQNQTIQQTLSRTAATKKTLGGFGGPASPKAGAGPLAGRMGGKGSVKGASSPGAAYTADSWRTAPTSPSMPYGSPSNASGNKGAALMRNDSSNNDYPSSTKPYENTNGNFASFSRGNTVNRSNTAKKNNNIINNNNQTVLHIQAPTYVITPSTMRKPTLNTSKAAKRASLAWWQSPGVKNLPDQQQPNSQDPQQTESQANQNQAGGGGGGGGWSLSLSRTVATLGAGAGSQKNFDYYEMAAPTSNTSQNTLVAAPAPTQMGPGSRLKIIHPHQASLEDELTVGRNDKVILQETYGDGWCWVKLASSKQTGPGYSKVGDEGMIPVSCMDIMETARMSVAPGGFGKEEEAPAWYTEMEQGMRKDGKRVKSLLRPESVALFTAAGRDFGKYYEAEGR